MRDLYLRIEDAKNDSEVQVRLSYLEIYNETIRDLLSVVPTPAGQGLALREDSANKISVVGISEHIPQSPEHVLEMITEGNKRRTMSPTEANAVSSRSHAVLQVNVTQRPRTANTVEETTSASLNIIDLAGSERAAATRNNGARMKEGANINKSLLALGNCINALCQSGGQKGKHIPYRNSKLTRLLKFSLGGNCKTVMIVCVSPSSSHYEETHNTLKYANQAKNIRTKVTRNMLNVDRHVAQYVQAIHELKEEVTELKAKLSERGTLETAAEKRRKVQIASEVEEAKQRMRESTENVKRLVHEKAAFEAQIAAAEARLQPLRARLHEIDEEVASFAARGQPAPADLESERDILRQLAARDEALCADPVKRGGVNSLGNSLQMQHAIIVAASHNQKFDEAAAEMIKNLGTAMLAEVESAKLRCKHDALVAEFGQGAGSVRDLVTIAARCTVALKEAADRLESQAQNGTEADGDVQMADGDRNLNGMVTELSSLAASLRNVSIANDEVFVALAGRGTVDAPPRSVGGAQRPIGSSSALRRPRNSLSQAPMASTSCPAAPPSAAGPAMGPPRQPASRVVRRCSVAGAYGGRPGVSSPAKPPTRAGIAAPAPPRPHLVSSPRKAARRQSVGGRRTSGIGLGAKGPRVAPAIAAAAAAADKGKKTFRWADEAGEGNIDDGGWQVNAAGAEQARRPAPPAQMPAPSSGSSEADESSPEPGHHGSRIAALRAAAAHARTGSDTDVSSGTEWEDYQSDVGGLSRTASVGGGLFAGHLAANTSNGADVSSTAAAPAPVRAAPAPKRGGMFDRNFLAKRAAANSVSKASNLDSLAEDEDDDDGESDDSWSGEAQRRPPFSEVGNASSSPPRRLTTKKVGVPAPGSGGPAPVRKVVPPTPEGGVGPVRRKGRSSLIPTATPSLGVGSAAGAPGPSPRLASGPPGHTAARLNNSPRKAARRSSLVHGTRSSTLSHSQSMNGMGMGAARLSAGRISNSATSMNLAGAAGAGGAGTMKSSILPNGETSLLIDPKASVSGKNAWR